MYIYIYIIIYIYTVSISFQDSQNEMDDLTILLSWCFVSMAHGDASDTIHGRQVRTIGSDCHVYGPASQGPTWVKNAGCFEISMVNVWLMYG